MRLSHKEREKIHRQFVESRASKERITWVGYRPSTFSDKRIKAKKRAIQKEISMYC